MKTKGFIAFFMAIIMIAFAQVSHAQTAKADKIAIKENWVFLGTRVVDYTLDHDVIALSESAQAFTTLKFKVKDGPINLHKCTVHFVNGETQDVDFAASTDGSIIDLKGNTRHIEKVTFWYDTKNSSDKKATVEVWGKNSSLG